MGKFAHDISALVIEPSLSTPLLIALWRCRLAPYPRSLPGQICWHALCHRDNGSASFTTGPTKYPYSTVFVTKGEKMKTSKKTTRKQPRFFLSMREGQITYTCRGCQHHCHHPEAIVRHLQECHAS
jgi:hypothetical protein